jgi:hypothetical protein
MIFREVLDKVTPSNVLGDVMTDAQYNESEDKGEENKEDKKEKSIAFKVSSTSKGKTKKEAS